MALGLSGVARADHELGHNHPFCAQGGDGTTGGEGGTIADEEAVAHFADTQQATPDFKHTTVRIPEHLGPLFGEDDPRGADRDPQFGQFIQIQGKLVDDAGVGSNGTKFHGGHGGGPGGGQGGSTFFGAGDGGCNPNILETSERFNPPFNHLPVTGSATEQFGLLAALFFAVGATMWMVSSGRVALAGADEAAPVTAVTAPKRRRGQDVVSRLRREMSTAWRLGGR
jgi:hypothetical protein